MKVKINDTWYDAKSDRIAIFVTTDTHPDIKQMLSNVLKDPIGGVVSSFPLGSNDTENKEWYKQVDTESSQPEAGIVDEGLQTLRSLAWKMR